ncbi:MAG: bifunctional glutamate N-acetyltransferase/amino-acid acetyltransferase ArgJ [Chloroflexota bacterium]
MSFDVLAEGSVTSPTGYVAAAVASGLKQSGNLDLAVIYSKSNCAAAGVFTRNQVVAAPVILDRQVLTSNRDEIRGVVANAGNANACTGEAGLVAARQTQEEAAALLGCRPEQLLILSTGVIGLPLPMDTVRAGLHEVVKHLDSSHGIGLARAIMTTDTKPKHLALRVQLPNGVVTIGGVAKGSGMIHPNMATMLGILTTDAIVPAGILQDLLKAIVERTFNRISVDGDTSTNDTVFLLANGASHVALDDAESLAQFAEALEFAGGELAKMIVRDGEGATKFVEIHVRGASDPVAAHAVAETVVTSPLVKTALAGSDPNWGRILAAAGRSGVALDQRRLALTISSPGQKALQLVQAGSPTAYLEAEAAAIFAQPEITIQLDLGQGNAEDTMWTTDLSHDYVTINADYRT